MKFVYVLEDDPKFQQEIVEAIAITDPKIQVRLFPQLDAFAAWMKFMMTTGPAAIAQGGIVPSFAPQEPLAEGEAHQLVLVISKIEFLGVEQLGLLRKTRDLFIQRQICTKEDPTGFVLTAFDDPSFKITELEDRILNNVIFKPFDRLILAQDLTFAIDGRHPPSKNTIANQKTTAIVEMLKDVELEAISDIGIITKSYREIPVGAISKYYGKQFLSDRQRSLFAICQSCMKHPEFPDAFRAHFTYFSADQTQISSFRKKTHDKNAKVISSQWDHLACAQSVSEPQILLMDDEEIGPSGLQGHLEKTFRGLQLISIESVSALIGDIDPAQALQQKDANLKTLGGAASLTLHFDTSGSTYLGFESDKADLTTFFGTAANDLKNKSNWFHQAVIMSHRERLRKYVSTGTMNLSEDNYLSLNVGENSFMVSVKAISKEGGKFNITLGEPSKDEQIKWMQKDSRIQKPVHLIIASHRFFGEGAAERWKFVKEALKKKFNVDPQIIMTSKKDFTDAEERLFGTFTHDILFKPLDRIYFGHRLKALFPKLVEKGMDKIIPKTVPATEIIKAVNPVTVSEISEAGFVMQYYRSITVGSFREMILWQPYEIGAPEFLATCNYVEENQGQKGTFNCHFVFFGITDNLLKRIRIWIRDNYVLSKEGQGG